jgi:membrane peptidoglycan carboxypeptidase
LNIPAVKAQVINGTEHVFDMAQRFGMRFQGVTPRAGLSLTLGTEVTHIADVAESYATLANEGRYIGYTHVLRITDGSGKDLVPPYTPPAGETVVSPQAAYVMTDILQSNTRPGQNPIWGAFELTGPNGQHRPATLKTGTNNDANDLVAFGYTAPPGDEARAAGEYALVVGAWSGNSDGSPVLTPENPVLSTDVAAPMWRGFMREVTATWPVAEFVRPQGIVEADVDGPSARSSSTAPCPVRTRPRSGCRSSRTRSRRPTIQILTCYGWTAASALRRRGASWRSRASRRAIPTGKRPTWIG